MNRVRKILFELFGPTSKFSVGDSVELVQGSLLMVVIDIVPDSDTYEPLVHCEWSESEKNFRKFFSEKDLKLIDWYHPEPIARSHNTLSGVS
jgi:uncharacterized protein YodC (DUF2158 family)